MEEPSGHGHLSEDALEEYAFNRLSEAEEEILEEHLLLCTLCQEKLREVDEYILLMKQATAAPIGKRAWISVDWEAIGWGRIAGGLAVLAFAAIGIGLGLQQREPARTSQQVVLVAFRGAETAHVNGGRPIDIVIDATDLPASSGYAVDVVDTEGRRVSHGIATAAGGQLSAHIAKALGTGVYWVRLYAASGEQLREYGLRAE